MRRGRRANALSLQATMPPFLPVWLTGDSYGAVSAYSLLSTPISRRSSLVLTQDAGGTRSATPCQALIAVRRAKCNVWRTSLTSSEAPAACETCGAQSGPIRPHRRVPCRSRKRRLSKRTVSCGLCGVICIFSRVAQTTVLACHSNPATRYKTPLRLTCWTFSVITPAMFWLRSVLRRLPSLEYKLDIGNRIVDF
jgi:hypothetical protein